MIDRFDEAPKPWWQSRTLILNAIAGALVAFEGVTGLLQPYLPVDFYTALAVSLPVVNAVLRVVTYRPLRWSRDYGGTRHPPRPIDYDSDDYGGW